MLTYSFYMFKNFLMQKRYLPTISNSFWFALGRNLLQRSIVNTVLELLKIEVREVTMADNIAAIIKPRAPTK